MIIDFHTHIYPEKIAAKGVEYIGNFYEFTLDTARGTKAHLDDCCKAAGVDAAVLLSVSVSPEQVSSINNFLSSCLDERHFGFGAIHPDMADPFSELDRFTQLGITGIKIHPDMQKFNADDPKMLPIYEYIEGKMPIMIHAGDHRYDHSSPKRIARVLEMFPNLTVIAAHLGGWSRWEDAEKYLCGKDVYFDTSSSTAFADKELLRRIILKHNPDKILFGTDYPITPQSEELERLYSLDLPEGLLEKILYKNAAELLKIDIDKLR